MKNELLPGKRHDFFGESEVLREELLALVVDEIVEILPVEDELDEAAILAEVAALAPALGAGMAELRREAGELEPYYRALYLRAMARDVGMNRRGGQG